ncbi:MAG: antitoxin Xre/MbcA/ParS toxin-binding domain-containing protein [Candidatus Thiodiazotropha lotti]
MSTKKKLIATPNKGAAVSHRTERGAATAQFTKLQVHNKATKEGTLLVQRITGVRSGNREKMLACIKKGLKYSAITLLEAALHTSQKELAQVLSIPPSTLQRRKKAGQLQTDESDRVVRLASLKDAAVAMMRGDDAAAVAWLRTPLDILGGESPLAHASTELGARDVEDLIGRLRHGVFS